jgi:hypothetical protein
MHKSALLGAAALLLLAQLQLASAQAAAAAAPGTAAAALPAEMAGSCPLKPEDFATIDYAPLRRACGEHRLVTAVQHRSQVVPSACACSRLVQFNQQLHASRWQPSCCCNVPLCRQLTQSGVNGSQTQLPPRSLAFKA